MEKKINIVTILRIYDDSGMAAQSEKHAAVPRLQQIFDDSHSFIQVSIYRKQNENL
jgi:hypothetical protein